MRSRSARLTRNDLRAFVTKYYIPNASHLIVVGDIDVDKTFAEIEKAFGSWKSGTVPPDENPPVPKRDKRQIYFVNRPGSIQSAIYIGNVSIPRKDKDYFAIRTANTIYGGSFYSRLTRNIRESKGLHLLAVQLLKHASEDRLISGRCVCPQ